MLKIFLAVAGVATLAFPLRAGNPSLLLVAHETTIRPESKLIFDVYLCNTGPKAVKAPPLQLITTSVSIRNTKDIDSPAAGSVENEGETRFNPAGDHLLPANTVETRRIERKISARPGDMVEVYVTVGKEHLLKSNSVLLLCPPENQKP